MLTVKTSKTVCLECQTYEKNCKPGCSRTNLFVVSTSFRPPKIGSARWKLVEKLIRKNTLGVKESPTDVPISASFSRHGSRKSKLGMPGLSRRTRERAYLENRLKFG